MPTVVGHRSVLYAQRRTLGGAPAAGIAHVEQRWMESPLAMDTDSDRTTRPASDEQASSAPPALISLKRGERIQAHAKALDASVVVTDRRLVVASDSRLMLDVPFDRLRRIQFDIERARPAALVVVPEWPSDPPQVLSVQPEQYRSMAEVLTYVGVRIHPKP
jgi:hypothetical protein